MTKRLQATWTRCRGEVSGGEPDEYDPPIQAGWRLMAQLVVSMPRWNRFAV